MGFPGGSDSKESAYSAGDLGLVPGSGRSPGEGNGYPLPVLLPGKFQGQGSLVGYNPWGCKELDVTAAAAKSLQLCPILCDPIDGSPPGSAVPGILQARTLEWVAISFSKAWKWKVKVNSFSCVQLLATHGLQPTRLLRPWHFPTGIDQKFQVIFHIWEIKSLRNTCIQVIILIFDKLFPTHSIHQCIWSCSYPNIKSACISSFWKHNHLLSSLSYSVETTVHRNFLCCQEAHIQVEGRERNVRILLQYNNTHDSPSTGKVKKHR